MNQRLIISSIIALVMVLWATDTSIIPQNNGVIAPIKILPEAITIPRMLSYQGRLTDSLGNPVPDSNYQMTFRFYPQENGGSPFWTETQAVYVSSGLFSVLLGAVTPIASIPEAGSIWLSLQVGSEPELSPRLRIVSSAYSYLSERSANADSATGAERIGGYNIAGLDTRYVNENQANSVTSGMIVDGTIIGADMNQMGAGAGQVLKWNGSTWSPADDNVGTGDNAWVRGTPDSVLFTIRRLGIARGGANNMLYGLSRITHTNLGVACTTGVSTEDRDFCTVGGGNINVAEGGAATVSGGYRNKAIDAWTTIGGGEGNRAAGNGATIAGGLSNRTLNLYATIAGGLSNDANGEGATVGGGNDNTASGHWSTIAGGYKNSTSYSYSTVAGGDSNRAIYYYATVGGGLYNTASNLCATVAGGDSNSATALNSTIGGGHRNAASGAYTTVSGGTNNTASNLYATVGGGYLSRASGRSTTISGGEQNTASGDYATIGGGYGDTVMSVYGVVSGGRRNRAGDEPADTGVVIAGGYFNLANAKYTTIAGGYRNNASYAGATVAGGFFNVASGLSSTVNGGYADTASSDYATVSGGNRNKAHGFRSTVGGGYNNTASNVDATVGGGAVNIASGQGAVVCGGENNTASGGNATVGGGYYNITSGAYATVAGGYADTAAGNYSFAVGNRSVVPSSYSNSAAFNGQTATSSNQLRCGTLSKVGGTFTIDHPVDPYNKILNHYFVESPEMINIYRGSVVLNANGRAEVKLPDYFSALNRNAHIQLTGVGTSDVYVVEDIKGNTFVIGGKPGTKVYWQVTGERADVSAEAIRRMMPVEQPKTGALSGRMLDDEFLSGCMEQLEREGKASGINFRTPEGRRRYQQMKNLQELER